VKDRGAGLLALALAGAPLRVGAQDRPAAAIDRYARSHGFSGTILVERRGRPVYRGSFGLADRSFGVPVTAETRFRIASITKLFTSVLVLQLVDEGKLRLDARVYGFLPVYAGVGARRVSVHQLLNHTSGIENYDQVKSYEDAVRSGIPVYQLPHSTEELLTRYASGKLVHEPGQVFDYNNADYVILGRIVERITGSGFEDLLTERILRPLGMGSTGMARSRDIVPRLARTYFRPDSSAPFGNDLPVYFENWFAAGSMYSTAADLARFAGALYRGRLLRAETLERLLRPGLDDYGYGLWIGSQDIGGTKHRFAQRPGSIMGANTLILRYLDDDLTVIVLGNTNATSTDALGFFIGKTLIRP
jgi:CubicO group peptidase (beta-lactamase class C family)